MKSNKVFSSVDLPVVIAKTDGDIRVRSFKCKDSGIQIISNYLASPFSPVTGGRMIPVGKKVVNLSAAEVESFEELGKCPNCGATLAAHAALADALVDNRLHCIVCGEELKVEDVEETPAEEEVIENMDNEEVVEAETPAEYLDKIKDKFDETKEKIAEGDDNSTIVADLVDDVLDQAEENVEETEENIKEENPENETVTMETADAEEAPVEETVEEVIEETKEAPAEETAEETTEEEAPVTEEEVIEETHSEESDAEEKVEEPVDEEIRVDMLSRCHAGLNTKKIEIVSSGKDTFDYIMVSNKPVATLHKDRACAEIKDIFSNKGLLAQSLIAAIEDEGLSKAVISSFGIVPMVLKVKANDAVKKIIAEKVEEMTTQMDCEKEELEANLQQSLGIAAVGINRNIFADTKNVLAEDLIDSLEQIGIEDAREIVESSFERCGEEYLRTIVSKAEEFKGKSVEARNEIAATVAGANFKSSGLNLQHRAVAAVQAPEASQDNEGEVARLRNLFFGN